MPKFDILTLHPDMVRGPLSCSIIGRATAAGTIEVGVHDIRDHAPGRHRQVDDQPYGGGAGMVMKVDVVAAALEAVRTDQSVVLLTSPTGRPFNQQMAQWLAVQPHVIVICGHYEGIDARIETLVDAEVSLGDFVLTGGEIAALAVVDAAARLVPGVLGNEASAQEESFSDGLLEHPHYTRPAVWNELEVPDVLRSGHHGRIAQWRRQMSEERTRLRRPDLWKQYNGGNPVVDDEAGSE